MVKQFRPYVDIMQAPSEVTGSFILCVVKLPTTTVKFVVDCGMYQEQEYEKYNNGFKVKPDEVSFVVLTHNHVDHSGRLPYFVKCGFYGEIFTTKVTKAFLGKALYDTEKILRGFNKYKETKALYGREDIESTLSLVVGCDYNQSIQAHEHIWLHFCSNGHLFGAASVLVEIRYPGFDPEYIFFSGDYNDKNMFFQVSPLRKWITELPLTVVIESTYAYMNSTDITHVFCENITNALAQGKVIVIPVFSLGRAQEILCVLKEMQESGLIDSDIPIYYDGKLSFAYTNIILKMLERGWLHFYKDKQEFLPENLIKVRNHVARNRLIADRQPKIIVSTSGNGSYGASKSYIKEFIQSPMALIHFTGYCTEDSLGYKLKTTAKGEVVSVAGLKVVKRAEVEFTTEFSAHAKADELIALLKKFKHLKLVLVNHGKKESKDLLSNRIVKEVDCENVGTLGSDYLYRVDSTGLVKTMPTKFG